MAQFNQLLGQTEKTSLEELTHYYPTIAENQTVQYIVNSIAPDEQHVQGQQILVSTDQLMLIENQAQVILDPTQVSYQPTSQYIVHDATAAIVDNCTQQRQVYYMKEEISNTKPMQQQPEQNSPIVLNHLQNSSLKTQVSNIATQKVITLQPQQMQQPLVRQIQNQPNQQRLPVQNRQLPQGNNMNSQRMVLHTQQPKQIGPNPTQRPIAPNIQQLQQKLPDKIIQRNTLTTHVPNKVVTPRNVVMQNAGASRLLSDEIPSLHFPQRNVNESETQRPKIPDKTTSTIRSTSAQVVGKIAHTSRTVLAQTSPAISHEDAANPRFTQTEISKLDAEDPDSSGDGFTLPNGTVVSIAEYKQMLVEKKKTSLGMHDKTESGTFVEPASPKKKNNRNAGSRGKANSLHPKVPRVSGRAPINKSTSTNTSQLDFKMQNNVNNVDSSVARPLQPPQMHQQFSNQQSPQNIRNLNHMANQQQFIKTLNQPRQNQQPISKMTLNIQQPQQQQQQQQPQNQQSVPKNMGVLQQNQQQNMKNMGQQFHQLQPKMNQQQQHCGHQQQVPSNIQQKQQQNHPLSQQPQQQQNKSNYVQPQYIIQPPSQRQTQQVCPLPAYVPSTQIQHIIESTPVTEEYNDSIRMLVLLENGEQRLITFTLPKEVCTIQEILEQVGVPFQKDTRIELIETNSNGINYFVTVGNFPKIHNQEHVQEERMETEEVSKLSPPPPSQPKPEPPKIVESPSKSPSPEPPKEFPKFKPGKCAVCNHCGYLSEDFNRCLRCGRKLPEDVKSVATGTANDRKNLMSNLQQGNSPTQKKDNESAHPGGLGGAITLNTKNPLMAKKKTKSKIVEQEPVILTLSSDDEEDHKPVSKIPPVTDHLLKRLSESAVSLSRIKKEPSASDIENNSQEKQAAKGSNMVDIPEISIEITCRTMRVGSYKFLPFDNKLLVKTSGLSFKIPSLKDNTEYKTINIDKDGIVKVLVSFQKAMPVLFYYCSPNVAKAIREELGMTKESEYYFDPLSEEEAHKRITVLVNLVPEEVRNSLRRIYSGPFNIMDELTTVEANELLCKTCPKEISSVIASVGYLEIKQLLIYPPGKGGLSINTEDYLCLGQDQFLNDVIIDFYLKYLILNLPPEQQEKVYVFSTFFYKRLTTKPAKTTRKSHPLEHDPNLTPSQKRHARVEKWTKSVNLFDKDYIIIPINENCHWFLAIICFPSLTGCYTFDGKLVKLETKKKKTVKTKKEEKPIPCEELEASDKDEAEGDESELESEEEGDSEEIISEKDCGQPIKQPCILIFDSLAGTGRSRVVATLRDYLTCEHKAKLGTEKNFTKDVIKGACPKVPQQTNFTDCGLYLLQYVEQFFLDPIKDYRMPIKQLKNWFEEIIVTKKREDIANLIKELMLKYNRDPSILPEITLPTHNGKLLPPDHMMEECEEFMEEEEEEEEDDDDEEEEEDDEEMDDAGLEGFRRELANKYPQFDKKHLQKQNESRTITKSGERDLEPFSDEEYTSLPSRENVRLEDGFKQETVLLKRDMSEASSTSSNRDTLSYLKAKRINRHKNVDHNDPKKFKSSN